MASFIVDKSLLTTNTDRIDSFLFWKASPALWPIGVHELCPLCGGDGLYRHGDVYHYCHCAMLKWARAISESYSEVFSHYKKVAIDQLDTSRHSQVFRAVDYAREWVMRPMGRLILSGGYGTGKSHILHSIATWLQPIALYMPAANFESVVFKGLGNQKLDQYMDIIKRAPILLLDDLGMEYGSPIVVTQLDGVIDFRYINQRDFPMAVATNYSGNELQTKGRYGSRLMDRDGLIYAGLPDVEDYRLTKR